VLGELARPTSSSGTSVIRIICAVEPLAAMRVMSAGTVTSRPASSVNTVVSTPASGSYCFPPQPENRPSSRARQSVSVRIFFIGTSP